MNIVKTISKPENAKALVFFVGLIMLGRSFYYFLIDDSNLIICTRLQCMQPQASILQVFRMEIPMFVMTIIWPIVFAALNLINDKVRIAHQMFYTIIGIHFLSCLLAAATVYRFGNIGEGVYLDDTFSSVIAVVTLTLLSSSCAIYLFRKKLRLFE